MNAAHTLVALSRAATPASCRAVLSRRDPRITWLAAADARGHLMRAHLVRVALAPCGVEVRILTTSRRGRSFLAALGSPSALLSTGYSVAFDATQNLDRPATEACLLRYLCSRDLAARDLATLRRLSRDADLVVNDFHPLPLIAPRRIGAPVVHVYGTHLWRAIAHPFEGRAPRSLDRLGGFVADALRRRALACLEHSLFHGASGPRDVLPPIVAVPARTRAEVRAALGVRAPAQGLAAVYLNPHFRSPRLASALEAALARRGFHVHAVGEGFVGRPGWRPYDPAFNDVAAAADVLVSAPGMGALSAWAHFGTPLLALRTDQPEQVANLRDVHALRAAPCVVVDVAGCTQDVLDRALAELDGARRGPRPDPAAAAAGVQARWTDALCDLLCRVRNTPPRGDP